MPTVIDTTVKNTICCGCGTCVAVCPKHNLEMQWNVDGEYNPVFTKICDTECGLCIAVCPFTNGNNNEDYYGNKYYAQYPGSKHTVETGYYLNTGVGYVSSDEARLHSVSGGLTTWFLQKILSNGTVDAVLCVKSNSDPEKLFTFTVAKSLDEIYAASGSAYYPVEMSEVITYVLDHPGKYAVVGVPCFLKSLRLAQERNSKLSERLVVFIGLVCGLIPNKNLVKYMSYASGLNEKPQNLIFRIKTEGKRSGRYSTFMRGVSSKESSVYWDEKNVGFARQCFGLHACDCCDDVFAECADVVFMDAWLPEYALDWKGTNIYLSRIPLVENEIQSGILAGELHIQKISIESVIKSQKPRLERKRNPVLAYNLSLMKKEGYNVPEKRTHSQNTVLSESKKQECNKLIRRKYLCRSVFRETEYDYETMRQWFAKEEKLPIPRAILKSGKKTVGFVLRKLHIRK